MKIFSQIETFNADLYTPVGLYLCLRDKFRKPCLLESNDYHSRQNSKSFIGLEPITEIQIINDEVLIENEGNNKRFNISKNSPLSNQVQQILDAYSFEIKQFNGFFGRIGFEFNYRDETHSIDFKSDHDLPLLHLFIFRYVIVIDHYTNEGYLIENSFQNQFNTESLRKLLTNNHFTELPFEISGKENAHLQDDEFAVIVNSAKDHCARGDVFQLVLSNSFEQAFFGDEFQVYRQLRMLNPSPYLFFFDFEKYRLFGSSPEAQLLIKNKKAEIHPIAGTVAKSEKILENKTQLSYLKEDEKENSEHTMLVDLARNDLSRDCLNVRVESYKEIQHFSHVIHMVSKVTGEIKSNDTFNILSHSFPAGTLSGTPKSRAMELIHQYEKSSRDYYGGAIGQISSNGDINMAIVIRSILSKNNVLHYRAGAGIVLDSKVEAETKEVHHKLKALRTAIKRADSFLKNKNSISIKNYENSCN